MPKSVGYGSTRKPSRKPRKRLRKRRSRKQAMTGPRRK